MCLAQYFLPVTRVQAMRKLIPGHLTQTTRIATAKGQKTGKKPRHPYLDGYRDPTMRFVCNASYLTALTHNGRLRKRRHRGYNSFNAYATINP
jgi:hypothetical protein